MIYNHTRAVAHRIEILAEHFTVEVLRDIALALAEECGGNASVSVEIHGLIGPVDDRQIIFQVKSNQGRES